MTAKAKKTLIGKVGKKVAEEMIQKGSPEEALAAIEWVKESLKRLDKRHHNPSGALIIFLEGCSHATEIQGVGAATIESMARLLMLPLPSEYIPAIFPLTQVEIFLEIARIALRKGNIGKKYF